MRPPVCSICGAGLELDSLNLCADLNFYTLYSKLYCKV